MSKIILSPAPKQRLWLKLLPKIGVGASLIIGVISAVYDPWTVTTEKIEYKTPNELPEIKFVNSFEDIELVQKVNGCTITFVNNWNQNKTYKAKEFFSNLTKEQKSNRRRKMIKAVNKELKKCRPGSVITLSYRQFEEIFLEKFAKHKAPKSKVVVTIKRDENGKKTASKRLVVKERKMGQNSKNNL